MLKKDLFLLTISVLIILLLITTPINQRVKNIGNIITGYAVPDIVSSESDIKTEEQTTTEENPASTTQKIEDTSKSLKTPDITFISDTLKLSNTEKIIVKELAGNYLEQQAKKTKYQLTQTEPIEIPKEVKLSIPAEQTSIILSVEDKIYPKIKLKIKA